MQTQTELLKQIETMEKTILIPSQVAPILGTDPQTVRMMARQMPERLGFPVIVMKSRVKIPRLPFIKFIKGSL